MITHELDEFYPTPLLLDQYIHLVLFLLDHTALGTYRFKNKRDKRLTEPMKKFWSTDHIPISRPFDKWDLDPYRPTTSNPTPDREGPDTQRTAAQAWIVPDQEFSKDRRLPTMTWADHAWPRHSANPLASAAPAAPVPPVPLRRVRVRPRVRIIPAPLLLNPPGRPPDSGSSHSSGESSPDLLTFSDL